MQLKEARAPTWELWEILESWKESRIEDARLRDERVRLWVRFSTRLHVRTRPNYVITTGTDHTQPTTARIIWVNQITFLARTSCIKVLVGGTAICMRQADTIAIKLSNQGMRSFTREKKDRLSVQVIKCLLQVSPAHCSPFIITSTLLWDILNSKRSSYMWYK